jgi:hypothetical protein
MERDCERLNFGHQLKRQGAQVPRAHHRDAPISSITLHSSLRQTQNVRPQHTQLFTMPQGHELRMKLRIGRIPATASAVGDPDSRGIYAVKANNQLYIWVDSLPLIDLNGLMEEELDGPITAEIHRRTWIALTQLRKNELRKELDESLGTTILVRIGAEDPELPKSPIDLDPTISVFKRPIRGPVGHASRRKTSSIPRGIVRFCDSEDAITTSSRLFQHRHRNRDLAKDLFESSISSHNCRGTNGHCMTSLLELVDPNSDTSRITAQVSKTVGRQRKRPATRVVRPGIGGPLGGSTSCYRRDIYLMPLTESLVGDTWLDWMRP